jgi:hypothetical protein
MKPGDLIQIEMGGGIGIMCAIYIEPVFSSKPPFLPTGAHEFLINWENRLQKMRFVGSALVE